MPRFRYSLAIVATLLTACSGNKETASETTVTRIDVSPRSVFLAGAGQSAQLTVRAYAADGRELDAAGAKFTSSAGEVSVGADGTVTATQAAGSALVTVSVGDVSAIPVFVVAATPVEGAVLLSDSQIATAPTFLPPEQRFRVGALFTVGLTVAPMPEVGAIILSTGQKPVGGRVVAVDGGTVTYEVLPISSLFTAVNIDVTYAPEVTRQLLEPLDTPGALTLVECESEAGLTTVTAELELSLDPSLSMSLQYDYDSNTLRSALMRVTGRLDGEAKATLSVGAGISGSVACALHVARIPLPMTGPLSPFFGFFIPIDAVAKADIDVSAGAITLGSTAQIENATLEMGFTYSESAGLVGISAVTAQPELDTFVNVGSDSGLRVTATGFLGLGSGIALGNTYARADLIALDVGGELEAKLTGPYQAALDSAFDSGYEFKSVAALGAGDAVGDVVEAIGIPGATLDVALKREHTIASSPQSTTLRVDKSGFSAGETLMFHVELDPASTTFRAGYNVVEVRVYRLDYASGAATQVAGARASDGQVTFDIPWVADAGGSVVANGRPSFFAFVVDKALEELSQTIPFELGDFQGQGLEIRPQTISLSPGATHDFGAYVDNVEVGEGYTWTATGGDIDSFGTYTAGATTGSFEVRITNDATGQSATAAVRITSMRVTPELVYVPLGGLKTIQVYAGTQQLTDVVWDANGAGVFETYQVFRADQQKGMFIATVTSPSFPGESASVVIMVGAFCEKQANEKYCLFPLPVSDSGESWVNRYCGTGINDDMVVGGHYNATREDGSVQSVLFTYRDGRIQTLSPLEGGESGGTVSGINSVSNLYGSAWRGDLSTSYDFQAFVTSQALVAPAGYTTLDVSGASYRDAIGVSVSADASRSLAFTLWRSGAPTLLSLPSGEVPFGSDMNDAGVGVFGSSQHLYRVSETDFVSELLPHPGTDGFAYPAISDNGKIVVQQYVGAGQSRGTIIVLWDGGASSTIGAAYPNGNPYPVDINNAGTVLGYVGTSSSANVPAVLHEGQMVPIRDLIPPGSGWSINRVYDINNHGQIVACGTFLPPNEMSSYGGVILQPVD